MVSHQAAAAQEQARQADGKFGGQIHSEAHGVVLETKPDLSLFFEEDRTLPRALYGAGLTGTLEPYNGDYPVNDGALRYWSEELNRELLVGTVADGTTVVALDAELSDPVRISVALGSDPSPDEITAAIRDVSGQVQRANLPDLDEE